MLTGLAVGLIGAGAGFMVNPIVVIRIGTLVEIGLVALLFVLLAVQEPAASVVPLVALVALLAAFVFEGRQRWHAAERCAWIAVGVAALATLLAGGYCMARGLTNSEPWVLATIVYMAPLTLIALLARCLRRQAAPLGPVGAATPGADGV